LAKVDVTSNRVTRLQRSSNVPGSPGCTLYYNYTYRLHYTTNIQLHCVPKKSSTPNTWR